ncbi:MAG TPA: heme exporter protein CcmD [Pseudomonadales bacterium]|nr:heme exporter protein CcmD [Pseudomonadales bacterium]
MQFSSLSEFINMGGQGLYVWSSYGISLLVLTVNVLVPLLRKRSLSKEIQQTMKREAKQRESRS